MRTNITRRQLRHDINNMIKQMERLINRIYSLNDDDMIYFFETITYDINMEIQDLKKNINNSKYKFPKIEYKKEPLYPHYDREESQDIIYNETIFSIYELEEIREKLPKYNQKEIKNLTKIIDELYYYIINYYWREELDFKYYNHIEIQKEI